MDVSQGPAAGAITRAGVSGRIREAPRANDTSVISGADGSLIGDGIFTRGRVRSLEPLAHRSVSASDHYPLSIHVALV
jgi:hypothetical protein